MTRPNCLAIRVRLLIIGPRTTAAATASYGICRFALLRPLRLALGV